MRSNEDVKKEEFERRERRNMIMRRTRKKR